MFVRPLLLSALVLSLPCFAQFRTALNNSDAVGCAPLNLRITDVRGNAVTGAIVDIVNADSGLNVTPQAVAMAPDVTCVPPGHYRVTATVGLASVAEDVILSQAGESVTLRLPMVSPKSEAGQSAVSVADLKVPEKARRELDKAKEKLRAHDMSGAFSRVEEALKIDSHYSAAYQLRGLLELTQEHVGDAISDLDRAIKLDAGNAMARIILGSAYNSAKRFGDAVRTLEAALPLAANAWQVQYELGKAYAGAGQLRQSLECLNRAMALNPSFSGIRYARAFVLIHAGQYQDAATDLKQYLHDNPNGPEAEQAKQLLATIGK